MKLRFERVGRDRLGNPILSELRQGTLRTAVLNIIKILDDNPKHGLVGYTSMTQMQAAVMWEYWRRYNNMPEHMTQSQFFKWFTTEATFPDIIRRACQWLDSQKLVEIDPAVEANAKANAKYLQGSFAGVGG